MPTPLIPWETCNVPSEIQKELTRRKTVKSFNYQKNDGWNKDGGDWEQYKGPMTAWVRVCSNGIGRPSVGKPGFVMTTGKNFYQSYGFQTGNEQILGYTPDGKPHVLENDINTSNYPIHVPNPEITKVETIIQKELYRRCWIHWTCFSSKQLEYMTPYFLVPRISVIVEFGWNLFNQKSLINLIDTAQLKKYYFENPFTLYNENILLSNGNYDVIYGLITNYEWFIEGNKINCVTEVTSKDRLYSGIPISSTVTDIKTGNTEEPIDYFPNIRSICDANFINNLKAISSLKDLNSATESLSQLQLFRYITSGTPMKAEYWRGVFYGRDDNNIKLSKNNLDYEWTVWKYDDFDKTTSNNNVWVNMGFIVELLNRCFPAPDPTERNENFFKVDVDQSVIGAHPNHISSDGSKLLIPNALAPKYMWGMKGLQQNLEKKDITEKLKYYSDLFFENSETIQKNIESRNDYLNQFHDSFGKRKINKKKQDPNDPLWFANRQLTKTFYQGDVSFRNDIDWVINANRYIYPTERDFYCFPFINVEEVEIKNRDKKAKYDPYFYGYFKDLYINVQYFVDLVTKRDDIKTYKDLYNQIFRDFNSAGGNFWEFALVQNDNSSNMVIVDNRMLPSGNNKSTPWYFDYMDADQLMTNLGFKPKMSDAQAFRVIFGETNNSGSRIVVKEENDLLDYKFDDRILSDRNKKQATIVSDKTAKLNAFKQMVANQQTLKPIPGQYQFTIMVNEKPYFRRLCLPNADLLNCLLDDGDQERNQRYTGIQPITVEVGLQGIGGLRTFMTFLIRNLPNPYHHNDVCYRIVDVHHTIQNGKWDTIIKAGILPLRDYIKQKIGISVKNVDKAV